MTEQAAGDDRMPEEDRRHDRRDGLWDFDETVAEGRRRMRDPLRTRGPRTTTRGSRQIRSPARSFGAWRLRGRRYFTRGRVTRRRTVS